MHKKIKMKIQTTVPVEFNTGINQKKNAVVCGVIQNAVFMPNGFGANFVYTEENGTPIHQNAFELTNEATNTLHEQVKGDIPEGLNFTDHMQHMFYLGFVLQMAETFNIAANQIEIIND